MAATPLIWPLLDRLRPPVAYQRRPKAAANQTVTRIPSAPWDDPDRPPAVGFGQVESDPQLWNNAPWNFGLVALQVQPIELKNFKTNPRAPRVSEQQREPAPVHPLALWQVFPPDPAPRDDRQTRRIIWPLLNKLSPIVGAQQRPKATPQTAKPVLPWSRRNGVRVKPAVVRPPKLPARTATLSGVTRDSAGAVLGGCVVELYETATNLPLASTVSDAVTGAFSFTCARYAPATHYLVAYLVGSPDVAGTTVNTLVGVG